MSNRFVLTALALLALLGTGYMVGSGILGLTDSTAASPEPDAPDVAPPQPQRALPPPGTDAAPVESQLPVS